MLLCAVTLMSKNDKPGIPLKSRWRYGIAEWYGMSFPNLTSEERKALAQMQKVPKKLRPARVCPFQSHGALQVICINEASVRRLFWPLHVNRIKSVVVQQWAVYASQAD